MPSARVVERSWAEGWREVLEPIPAVVRAAVDAADARIWMVTTSGQNVLDGDKPDPRHAAVFGIGRTLSLEHPQLWGGMIDTDGQPESASALVAALRCADGEDQLAIRAGRRYVARLNRVVEPPRAQRFSIDPDGTYLITGGLGGVGSRIARRLVAQGARHLVLIGRSRVDIRAERLTREFEGSGVRCLVLQVDVGRLPQVEAALARVDATMPPLRGVVHAAGVIEDGMLLRQNWSRLSSVIEPKVVGAAHLHRLTADRGLDLFVLMSSYAAVLGAPGQAGYAAANAGLEALAQRRAGDGLASTAIGWGPWDGVGMAADAATASVWSDRGIRPLSSAAALELFDELIAAGVDACTALDVDWSTYATWSGRGRTRPELALLASRGLSAMQPEAGALLRGYEATAPMDRERYVEHYVGGVVADVLGIRSGQLVDPDRGLFDLGIDSMMAVTLANRLRSELPDPTALPMTLAIDYPTVSVLAAAVSRALRTDVDQPLADLLDEVENMSDEQVARFLADSHETSAEGDAW
jgi:NAD(P)-dependent dehydrogenase (short-subunit alcohol dehydrogenase family)